MEQGKFVKAFFEQKLFVIFEILVKEYQSDRSCRIGKFMFLVMFFCCFFRVCVSKNFGKNHRVIVDLYKSILGSTFVWIHYTLSCDCCSYDNISQTCIVAISVILRQCVVY